MNNLLNRTKTVYNEYPRAFWIYNIIVFIDRLGGFMLYPFFALYLTQKYQIGMATVGLMFAVFSITGMVGTALGGAIADRMGRKTVIIFSLVLSSLSALGMGLAPTIGLFIAIVFLTFYFIFKNKVTQITLSINLQAVEMLRSLVGKVTTRHTATAR